MKKTIAQVAFVIMLAPYVFAQSAPGGRAETVRAFRVEAEALVFTVYDSGYTDKSSFRLDITKTDGIYEIELIRVKDDSGKMMPRPVEIAFTKDELRDRLNIKARIRVRNAFQFGWLRL
jgi:hypothetical protein